MIKPTINNKILLILSLFLIFLVIGTASAVDDDSISTNDTLTVDDAVSDDIVSTDTNENTDELSEGDSGSFTELQTLINSGSGTISLDKDYTFNSASDSNLKDGIKVTKTITINGNGKTIDANNSAKIFEIAADNVVLNNLILKNAGVNQEFNYIHTSHNNEQITRANGAGIMWTGNNGVLKDTTITGTNVNVNATFQSTQDVNVNYIIANGAGIYWSGNNGLIENTKIINTHSNIKLAILDNMYSETNRDIKRTIANGVALYMSGTGNVIRNSQISGTTSTYTSENSNNVNGIRTPNVSDTNGNNNAIYISGASNTIEGSTIKDNQNGIRWTAKGTLKSSTISNSSRTRMDGVASIIDGCLFTNNINSANIAALYVTASVIVLKNSNFTNNYAGTSDGAVYWSGYRGTVDNCNFINNTANTHNAGLSMAGQFAKVTNCNFINNTAGTDGGALRLTASSATVDNCKFIDNTALNGGAIYSTAEGLTIKNSYFNGNKATSGIGDGIYATGSVSLSNNTFNDKNYLVAVLLEDRDFYISPDGNGTGLNPNDCANFAYAYAKIGTGRNIILTPGTYKISGTIAKSIGIVGQDGAIVDMNGKTGRVFTISGSDVVVKNIVFKNAKVSGNGGVISWSGNYGSLIDCTFMNNTATGTGGAVYYTGWTLKVTGNTFSDNFAQSSNDLYYANSITLTNNVFCGDYIKVNDEVLIGHEDAYLKITRSNGDMRINVNLNGESVDYMLVKGNTPGDIPLTFGSVTSGEYAVDVSITGSDGNKYTNTERKFIKIYNEPQTFYVSDSGADSRGLDYDHPTNWETAMGLARYGATIILVGTFKHINSNSKTINKGGMTVKGSGNTIIDGQNSTSAFNVNAKDVTIKDITFINGRGSTIVNVANSDNFLIENCKFINNVPTGNGALTITGSYNATVKNCTFTGNHYRLDQSGDKGGAITSSGGILNVIGSKFTDNTARNGGAINIVGSQLTSVDNCIFENNKADSKGGAICLANGVQLTLTNSQFTNNNATTSNDIYYVNIGSSTFKNNQFKGTYFEYDNITNNFVGPFDLKATATQENITYEVKVDGGISAGTYTMVAGTSGNIKFNLLNTLPLGKHYINIEFTNNNNQNTYTNVGKYIYVSESILYVNSTGTGIGTQEDKCSLQYALEHIVPGLRIIMDNGTYKFDKQYKLDTGYFTIEGSGNTTLYGQNKAGFFYQTTDEPVTFKNLIFKNGAYSSYTGDNSEGLVIMSSGLIDNCIFTDNSGYNAVLKLQGLSITVRNSTFNNCKLTPITSYGGAIYITSKCNVNIIGCTFNKNGPTTRGGAIYANNYNNLTIDNCEFNNNSVSYDGGAITVKASNIGKNNILIISNSIFNNNSGGVYNDLSSATDDFTGLNVVIVNNTFIGSYLKGNYSVTQRNQNFSMNAITFGNNFTFNLFSDDHNVGTYTVVGNFTSVPTFYLNRLGNGNHKLSVTFESEYNKYINTILADVNVNILPTDNIYYVSPNGTGDGTETSKCNLTYALTHASPNARIILENGVYLFDKQLNFDGNNYTIEGSGNTILDGQNKTGFFNTRNSGSLNPLNLRNLIFRNGKYESASQPDLVVMDNGVVEDCIFENNTGYYSILRFFYSQSGFNNVISNCRFTNNSLDSSYVSAGGALNINHANAIISNCTFINNTAPKTGGAIFITASQTVITNCEFENNKVTDPTGLGGAIYFNSDSSAKILYSTFKNNKAPNSNDIYRQGTSLQLYNNTFIGAYAGLSGEVTLDKANVDIRATANNYDTIVNVIVGDKIYNTIMKANTVGNTKFNLYNLTAGKYNLTLSFTSLDNNNRYINNVVNNFTILPTIYYVSHNGTGNGSENSPCNLSTALKIAKPGSTILLANGTYYIQEFTIETAGLKFIGSGNTVLDGQRNNRIFSLTSSAKDTTFTNLIFINGNTPTLDGGAISITEAVSTFNNCTFINNTARYGGAIRTSGTTVNVNNCTFIDNYATSTRYDYGNDIYLVKGNLYIKKSSTFNSTKNTRSSIYVQGGYLDIHTGIFYNPYFPITTKSGISADKVNIRESIFMKAPVDPNKYTLGMNWYGNNTPNINVDYLKCISVKRYDDLVGGEWNPAFFVYFVSSVTNEWISLSVDLQVKYEYTINEGSAEIKNNYLHRKNTFILPNSSTLTITPKIGSVSLDPVIFGLSETHGFKDLYNMINYLNTNEGIVLNNNYAFNPNTDSAFINGINITRNQQNLFVDGNGYTIDATGANRVFNVLVDSFTIKNVTIKNATEIAINVSAHNDKLEDITLEDINGTGIYVGGANARINGVKSQGGNGTVIDVMGSQALISNVEIDSNNGTAIHVEGTGSKVNGAKISNNTGVGVDITGTNVQVTDVNVTNFKGTGVRENGTRAIVKNVAATGFEGVAVDLHGLGAEVHDVKMDDYNGIGVKVEGTAVTVDNVNSTKGNGTAIDVTGYGDISNVNIDNHVGTGVNATGKYSTVTNVNATNVNGTGIDITGKGVSVADIKLENVTGTGVIANGTNATVSGVESKNSDNLTTVDIVGNNAKVEDVRIDNVNGTGVKVRGDNNTVDTVDVKNSDEIVPIDFGGNNNAAANINITDSNATIVIDGNGTNIGNVTNNNNNTKYNVTKGSDLNPIIEVNIPSQLNNNMTFNITIKITDDALGKLTVSIPGLNFNQTYDSKVGSIALSFSNVTAGNYNMLLTYNSNSGVYTNKTRTESFIVEDVKESAGNPDIAFDLSKANANPSVFTVNLPKDATGTFTVMIGGKEYKETVKNGTATISIPNLPAGVDTPVVLRYSGDDKYGELYKTTTVKVPTPKPTTENTVIVAKKKITIKKKKRSKTKMFTVTLKTIGGKPVAGQKVYFKLDKKILKKIKSKAKKGKKAKKAKKLLKMLKKGKYAVTTKANGKATLKLKKSMFKFKKGKGKLTVTFKGVAGKYYASKKIVKIVMK